MTKCHQQTTTYKYIYNHRINEEDRQTKVHDINKLHNQGQSHTESALYVLVLADSHILRQAEVKQTSVF